MTHLATFPPVTDGEQSFEDDDDEEEEELVAKTAKRPAPTTAPKTQVRSCGICPIRGFMVSV